MLKVENIVKRYASHTALNGVTIDVPKQSIFGLLGPNGAGKTSLIRIINQITAPDEGKVWIDGEKLARHHIENIGYLPEERGLYKKMKVGEQSLYLAQLKGMPKAEAKQRLKLWFERFEIDAWWDKKVEELSKGMAQKVQFITTVLHEPKLLILDEPFSGFDPINTQIIREEILRLRDEGATIILSTHNMGSVEEICDHIALINQSELVLSGNIEEVKQRFSEEAYEVTFKGNMIGFTTALWAAFELLESESHGDDLHTARVKMLRNSTLNDLLKATLGEVHYQSVRPIIPSMNDIFIAAIEHDKKEEAL